MQNERTSQIRISNDLTSEKDAILDLNCSISTNNEPNLVHLGHKNEKH